MFAFAVATRFVFIFCFVLDILFPVCHALHSPIALQHSKWVRIKIRFPRSQRALSLLQPTEINMVANKCKVETLIHRTTRPYRCNNFRIAYQTVNRWQLPQKYTTHKHTTTKTTVTVCLHSSIYDLTVYLLEKCPIYIEVRMVQCTYMCAGQVRRLCYCYTSEHLL